MVEILQREAVYLGSYLAIQVEQIAPYWVLGTVLGSLISVFGKRRIQNLFLRLDQFHLGILGLIPASLLGIASPLCLYGTIPIVAAFASRGMRQDWVAAFMMSSVLLNPQLLVYSAALGPQVLALRFLFCFLAGIAAGLAVRFFYRDRNFFSFSDQDEGRSRDVHPNRLLRLVFSIGRNIRATGPAFLVGIGLTALYQRYVPADWVASLFGPANHGLGVLTAAALGIPLYVCGGGTIPLLSEWLSQGMTTGSAVAFMLSGPATKITNLSALKIILSGRRFLLYLAFVLVFAASSGLLVDGFSR